MLKITKIKRAAKYPNNRKINKGCINFSTSLIGQKVIILHYKMYKDIVKALRISKKKLNDIKKVL